MPVTKVKPALGMTPPVNQVTAAQRSSGHYCPMAITPHTMNNLNINMATSLFEKHDPELWFQANDREGMTFD
jgi:hypothetical protein